MTAWKSVNPVFELWHRLVKVVDSACADAMCDVFLKKRIVFTIPANKCSKWAHMKLSKQLKDQRSIKYGLQNVVGFMNTCHGRQFMMPLTSTQFSCASQSRYHVHSFLLSPRLLSSMILIRL